MHYIVPYSYSFILCFCAGGSSHTFSKARAWLYQDESSSLALLNILTNVIIEYLVLQVQAGAQVLQVSFWVFIILVKVTIWMMICVMKLLSPPDICLFRWSGFDIYRVYEFFTIKWKRSEQHNRVSMQSYAKFGIPKRNIILVNKLKVRIDTYSFPNVCCIEMLLQNICFSLMNYWEHMYF